MKFRWIVTLGITFLSALLFAFVPAFNWFGARKLSLYHQFAAQGQIMEFFWHLLLPTGLIFFGLLFLFVFKTPEPKKPLKKDKEDKEDKDNIK